MKPFIHAKNSANKFGGKPDDYIEIHNFMDSSKSVVPDMRHRAIFHSAFGCFIVEKVFGVTITNSDGIEVSTRDIAEEHILEDLGRIPTLQDWLNEMQFQDWMMSPELRNKKSEEKNEFVSPGISTIESDGSKNDVHSFLDRKRFILDGRRHLPKKEDSKESKNPCAEVKLEGPDINEKERSQIKSVEQDVDGNIPLKYNEVHDLNDFILDGGRPIRNDLDNDIPLDFKIKVDANEMEDKKPYNMNKVKDGKRIRGNGTSGLLNSD